MSVRRLPAATLVALILALAVPALASAHSVLLSSTPAQNTSLASSPPSVTLRFNEGVQLLRPGDLSVVDGHGKRVDTRDAAVDRNDVRSVGVGLQPNLPDGTYTVRYLIVSADSHVVGGAFVFGVGSGPLAAPYLGGPGRQGPSETSVWAVSARFLELVGLGGLAGLLAFRLLVWRPVWTAAPAMGEEGANRMLSWERDGFWTAFGVLAVGAMIAEGYLLVVKTASALGVGVRSVLAAPADISTVIGSTHFGTLVQARAALLCAVFAVGAWRFAVETSDRGSPTRARPVGAPWALVLMLALVLSALGLVSAQGHASQAPLPGLQIGADLAHLASVAVWITGLAATAVVFRRLHRVDPGGAAVAARLLARFSLVAMAAVTIAIATGVVRSAGELSDPSQLWDTAYGRSIALKLLLLCPIAFLALHNRKVVTSLRRVATPTGATLRLVRRSVALELAFAVGLIVVASVLVAQVPGRT